MSEEILKALTTLFAIITKLDGGVTTNEREFVKSFFESELERSSIQSYLELYDNISGFDPNAPVIDKKSDAKPVATSVQDSLKTLAICKKINKTLEQKQKVIVLTKLFELVGSDKNFTSQRMEMIHTVATVFNITELEYTLIENLITADTDKQIEIDDALVISESTHGKEETKFLHAHLQGTLIFIRIKSVDMYFTRYLGSDNIVLNNFTMQPGRVYLFSHGSTIKTPTGNAIYYSDLVRHFNKELQTSKLTFNAEIEEFRFKNGQVGLRNIQVSEGPGQLIGIMGASGAGKTTLLNVLAGLEKPQKGNIKINGFDIHAQKSEIEGVIGYVAQDDLLIEELTVYENLYYNAKLCFSNLTEEELHRKVIEVLESLGLEQRKDVKVGNPLDKTISGGQRKRLNIALELIREPSVLFVDEPTSGLSSRDSENVIDLLKELSLKGKLIFVVIHQPSSEIYKMFDKMLIMDTGGYLVYYGHPVEAVQYFKKATKQIDSNKGQCPACGNVNPEQIFNILDAKVVDEYGQTTTKRKATAEQWAEMFKSQFCLVKLADDKEKPAKNLNIPTRLKQMVIFATRDLIAKISNKQYLLINLLEAPVLALILAYVIKYRSAPDGSAYMFRFNDNFPAFLLMGIIVALFMGLTVSAEEIIRDRKILKRESFLNLSWNSYLISKLGILFCLSAIQTLTFVIIGNLVLEVKGMTFAFWLVLFSTSCFSNVMGLNVSSAFKSAVTVYVLIPLLLIPQMILSGLLFSFDKLHPVLSNPARVPLIADVMASRWAYEAMAVYQFKNNDYMAPYFKYEQEEARADFKSAYVVDLLKKRLQYASANYQSNNDSVRKVVSYNLKLIENSLEQEAYRDGIETVNNLSIESFTKEKAEAIEQYLDNFKKYYKQQYNEKVALREKMIAFFESQENLNYNLSQYKDRYYNESMSELVRNIKEKDRVVEHKARLIQKINPIYAETKPRHLFDYRSQFFAPQKHFIGIYLDTYYFNIAIIWLMSMFLYLALYYEWLKKGLNSLERWNIRLKK
ncbi:MAG TPA: ATP-binding cassette domain-containing protein [Cyclobacteriaceae bacterium]|mgnify:CR=1 FL=1|nr:ATP-binding cassette domain-containing protein [Cyclobacteriaceae bacterium]